VVEFFGGGWLRFFWNINNLLSKIQNFGGALSGGQSSRIKIIPHLRVGNK